MSKSQTLLDMLDEDIEIAQDVEFSTENIQCPEVEAPGKISKITRRSFSSDGKVYYMLNVRWEIDSEEAREEVKQDKVFVDQSMFLNLDEERCKNMDAQEVDAQL